MYSFFMITTHHYGFGNGIYYFNSYFVLGWKTGNNLGLTMQRKVLIKTY